ncbi:hypothetical protein SB2_06020 [Methylobacterium radiotolerans]|nr:hypothetical protein SB3_27730 [Methylobacterium radiotolerans]KTS49511.1 hypothetical protein SB2_06020 [Methylobacterium radiotolerans]
MEGAAQQCDTEAATACEEPALWPPTAPRSGERSLDRAAQADPVGTGQGRVFEMGQALARCESQQFGQSGPARLSDPTRRGAFSLLGTA